MRKTTGFLAGVTYRRETVFGQGGFQKIFAEVLPHPLGSQP